MQNDENKQASMDQGRQEKPASCIFQSAARELRGDLHAAADDMRSFAGEIGSDIRGLFPRLKDLSSGLLEKARSSRRKGLAADIAEGAAALKDNADAHGDDIRRAVGLAAGQADAEITPEEAAAGARELAAGIAEGAAALKDNADAHGDDIRRAVGLTRDGAGE